MFQTSVKLNIGINKTELVSQSCVKLVRVVHWCWVPWPLLYDKFFYVLVSNKISAAFLDFGFET